VHGGESVRVRHPHEISLATARAQLADVVNDAAVRSRITYLTNRGRRVAAIVPLDIAEDAEANRPTTSRPDQK
jgi:prevent-host-death family protein